MVNIDTVYQKVLALANKEQRGYITPQEFNLMADKAQMEIFDTYFYDLKMAYQKPKTSINHGDEMELLHKKMYPFKATTNVLIEGGGTGTVGIPGNSYYIDSISTSDVNNAITGREVTELNQKEYINAIANPFDGPLAGASSHATPEPVDVNNCPSVPWAPFTLKFCPSTNGVVTEVAIDTAFSILSPVTASLAILAVAIASSAISSLGIFVFAMLFKPYPFRSIYV